MKYKTMVQISNDVSDTFLSVGDVFELEKVHVQQTGISWVEIKYFPKKVKKGAEPDNRDRPELITAEVLDLFCEEVEEENNADKKR